MSDPVQQVQARATARWYWGGGNSIRFYIYECKVKWSWGNGPHLLSETVTTIHKCRFLGHPSINVVTVQLAHPAVNITSRKNKIFYDIKDKKKEPIKKSRPFIL